MVLWKWIIKPEYKHQATCYIGIKIISKMPIQYSGQRMCKFPMNTSLIIWILKEWPLDQRQNQIELITTLANLIRQVKWLRISHIWKKWVIKHSSKLKKTKMEIASHLKSRVNNLNKRSISKLIIWYPKVTSWCLKITRTMISSQLMFNHR
jgi:hypothetical protein